MSGLHKDKNGNTTKINDLTTGHLKNIIRLIRRKAKEGVTIRDGGGSEPDDMWYTEETIRGDEVLRHMHHEMYAAELTKRQAEKGE